MANVYTSTDTNSSTALSTNMIATALDKDVAFELRSMPLHRDFADKRPTSLTNPGSVVTFNIYNRLTPTTAELDEVVAPDSVQVPATSTVSVTLKEHGRVVIPTLKLRTVTFADIDPGVAKIVADDMADSIDLHVVNTLVAGSNKVTSNAGALDATPQATNTIAKTDVFSAAIANYVPTKLRGNSASPWKGDLFAAVIHPDVAYDLRLESGSGATWRFPHEYQAGEEIWKGEVGTFGGAFYIETPRAYKANDGATSATVYRTLFLGRQALAEATAIEPHVTISEAPVDLLNRNYALGWYGLVGWNRYREAALYRVETGSSIA